MTGLSACSTLSSPARRGYLPQHSALILDLSILKRPLLLLVVTALFTLHFAAGAQAQFVDEVEEEGSRHGSSPESHRTAALLSFTNPLGSITEQEVRGAGDGYGGTESEQAGGVEKRDRCYCDLDLFCFGCRRRKRPQFRLQRNVVDDLFASKRFSPPPSTWDRSSETALVPSSIINLSQENKFSRDYVRSLAQRLRAMDNTHY